MSDSPEKKRPWFQYYLSTAVVLMFVLSGLLWLNIHSTTVPWGDYEGWSVTYHGWPLPWRTDSQSPYGNPRDWSLVGMVVDTAIAYTILFSVGCALDPGLRTSKPLWIGCLISLVVLALFAFVVGFMPVRFPFS